MSNSKFIITGVPRTGPPGQDPPSRLEINDFIKNQKQFSLYVLALLAMQGGSEGTTKSFFDIGGIHGKPYVSWNESPPPSEGSGYCIHATVLFPTWHRPYVATFEQVVQMRAIEIANKYTVDAESWKKAATDLRQPFWDWGVNSVPPDEIILNQKVEILIAPSGVKTMVDNPFFRYAFKGNERSSFDEPFKRWPTTLRHATSQDPDATSNVEELKLELSMAQQQIRQDTYRLFSIDTWPLFSTKGSTGGNTNSLESVHDGIHVRVGGFGHMSSVGHAGFDPIFYLHHCQVDRLVSLWSFIHDKWVTGADANKDLTPFWNTQTTYWASAGIQSAQQSLNYSYPEFENGATPAQVAQAVSRLYGSALAMFSGGPSQPRTAAPVSVTEWTVRVHSKQFELGGSFSVLLFLVDVPDDPAQWFTSPHFIGSFDAFVNSTPEECPNCQEQADLEIEGFVHINEAILKHSRQASLEPEVVVPFLTKDLHWRVLTVNGTAAELPSLEVVVITASLTMPVGATLPTVGGVHHRHGITHGRSGGSRRA